MRKQIYKYSPNVKMLLAGSLSAFILVGCTTYHPSEVPTPLRNKITVAETVERLELFAQPSGLNLSARDEDAVTNFVNLYARNGQGPMYINVPGNATNAAGVQQAKISITSRMKRMGIPGSAVQIGQYAAEEGVPAPVVVSFRRLTTAPIDCHQGAALTHTSTNQPYRNFGCAQTANLAAMVDNPRQFLAPYELSPSTMVRRSTVMDAYGNGESTSTPRPDGQEVSAGTAN